MIANPTYSRLRTLVLWCQHFLFSTNVEAQECGSDIQHRLFYQVTSNYGDLVERICFGYARTRADLDDLRQEALLNIWLSLNHFKGESSLKTWVYRVTLNSCVSSLRHEYRRISTVQLNSLYEAIDTDVEDKATLTQLHEAIACLNSIDKAIVMLWLDEVPYEEIASIIGISKANVAVRLHRAKDRLKSLFNK